jgi:hypothetical protein
VDVPALLVETVDEDDTLLCNDSNDDNIDKANGEINFNLKKLSGTITNAKINHNIVVKNTEIGLDFETKNLLIAGESDGKIKDLINLYKKNFQIKILNDNIVKGVKGNASAKFKFGINLSNKNINQRNFLIRSGNFSTFLEKNKIHAEEGKLNLDIDEKKIIFDSSMLLNHHKTQISGDMNLINKNNNYKMNIDDANYLIFKQIFNDFLKDILEIGGTMSVKMTIAQSRGQNNFVVEIDLRNAKLTAPYIKLEKKIGQPCELRFNMNYNGNIITMNNIIFNTENHHISVEKLQYFNHKKFLLVNNLMFNKNNLIDSIEVSQNNLMKNLKIEANSIIYDDFNWLGFTNQNKNDERNNEKININGNAKNLIFSNNTQFQNLEVDISCDSGQCQKIIVQNDRDKEKNHIYSSILQNKILVFTNNAGLLLAGTHVTNYINNGKLFLDGYINQYANGQNVIQSTANIDNFTIRKAPIVAKILSFASFTGILSIFTGQGVHFNHLITNFILSQNNVIFAKSVADGEAMGIIFEGNIELTENPQMNIKGSLTPMNIINILIRKIPILGTILVGTKGNGIFAASFELHGEVNKPAISVNPINILTPYTLKKIFNKNY